MTLLIKKKMRTQARLPVMLMLLALLAGYADRAAAQATAQPFAKPEVVRPFRVDIDQKRIDAILQRVRTARLPHQMPAMSPEKAAWETGADIQWLRGLRQYWTKQFDWRGRGSSVESVPAVQGARGWRGYPLLLRERRGPEPAAAPTHARMAWIRRRVSRRDRPAHPAVETRRTGGGRVHRDHPIASRLCLLGPAGRREFLEHDGAAMAEARHGSDRPRALRCPGR